MRTEDYRWGRNIPRFDYTEADLAYLKRRQAEAETTESRAAFGQVIAMVERRLGIEAVS